MFCFLFDVRLVIVFRCVIFLVFFRFDVMIFFCYYLFYYIGCDYEVRVVKKVFLGENVRKCVVGFFFY